MKPWIIRICAALFLLGPTCAMAAGAEGEGPRRLVVCLDGTQNSPEQDVESFAGGHKLYKPTNVLKTFRALVPVADGVNQIAFYSEGVGSQIGEPTRFARFAVLVDRIFGGAFGVGYEPRVKAAYRFLVATYQPGDQIFVFGFSRGAAEAQTLVRFIEWVGGVLPQGDVAMGGILHKQDEYYLPELYDGFTRSQVGHPHENPETAEKVFAEIRRRRHDDKVIEPPQPARIEFLGVYETVVSVGSRFAPDGKVTTVEKRFAYLVDEAPPKIVDTIRQALAVDERRWDFRPQIWRPATGNPSPSLVQLWFPGVHSNIGGGYRFDGLADNALEWMLAEANKHLETNKQLGLDSSYLDNYYGPRKHKLPCHDPSRPESDTAWFRFGDLIRGKSGRGVRDLGALDRNGSWERAGLGFHESLGALLIGDCTYRPRNLLQYLADYPARIAEFPMPAPQQDEIRQIVAEFKARSGEANPKPYHCQPSPSPPQAAAN